MGASSVGTPIPTMRGGSRRWWSGKVRQFGAHLRARVMPEERRALDAWLSPAQLALFDAMHRADQRHGLDVVASLRTAGAEDPELLLAGLLHDCGKGTVGVVPRVVWSLGEAYGAWLTSLAGTLVSPLGRELVVLRDHASRSAELAAAAGCSPRTAALIREQDAPTDPVAGALLHAADEAN